MPLSESKCRCVLQKGFVSYQLGAKDPFAHTKPDLLHGHFTKQIQPKTGKTRHQDWLEKYKLVLGRSKEDFVRHYKQKYGLPMPIWVSVEIWDFGMLSTFYQGMSVADKSAIASKYVVPDWKVMESWFRTLNFVRNVAAHHSRLWNKNLVDQPKLPAKGTMPDFDSLIGEPNISSRLFVVLCILKRPPPNLALHAFCFTRLFVASASQGIDQRLPAGPEPVGCRHGLPD